MLKNSWKEDMTLTVTLLYYYAKLIGLCPLNLNNRQEFRPSFVSQLYAIVISILYTILFCFAMTFKFKTTFSGQTTVSVIVDGFVHILQLGAIVLSWLIFAFRQKKLQSIIKNIQNTGEIGKKLGLVDDKSEIFKTAAFWAFFVITYFSFVFTIDQTYHFQIPSYKMILWAPYRYTHIVIHSVYFLFITALQIIERRFSRLNIVLRKCAKNNCSEEIAIQKNPGWRSSKSTSHNIGIVGQLHDELISLTEDITDFFALPILISLTVNFVNMVSSVNIIYLMTRHFMQWNWILSLVLSMYFLCFFANVIEFLFVSVVSGSISNEANNTGNVLYKIWINSKPSLQVFQIKTVLLQLLQNKLSISLYGFIDLNYEFMYRVCGTVMTYLIIVLQFDGDKSKKMVY